MEQATVRERPSVSKRTLSKFDTEQNEFKKLNDMEIPNTLGDNRNINIAWKSIKKMQ